MGLSDFGAAEEASLLAAMHLQAQEASHTDDLVLAAKHWLFVRSIVIPAPRRLLELSRAAFAQIEEHIVACVAKAVSGARAKQLLREVYTPRPPDDATHIEWLKAGPKRYSPSTLAQTLKKVRYLKSLGVHEWDLGDVVLAKQQAYAHQIQARRPAKSREIRPTIQLVEVVCFLRVTLLELTDTALHLASRRSQHLLRAATERAEAQRGNEAAELFKPAVQVRSVLHDETNGWQQRVIEAQRLLAGIGRASAPTFAARVRAALSQDSQRVHGCLAVLEDLDFKGSPADAGFIQWQAWLRAHQLPRHDALWNRSVCAVTAPRQQQRCGHQRTPPVTRQ